MTSAEPSGHLLVAGRVLRPHGVRGDVVVEVRTDSAGARFARGASLGTERGPLTVASSRRHGERLIVHFDGVDDRDAAERLRDRTLLVDVTAEEGDPSGDGSWFAHELRGCAVVTPLGRPLGEVTGLQPSPAHDLLVVRHGEREVLVPFVAAIVTEVDPSAGRVVVDPPGGLFDG